MGNGLLWSAASLRDIAGGDPAGEGGAEIPGLLVVIGQQLRLCRTDKTVVKFLQCIRDALVANPLAAPEQTCVSGVAGERMLERVEVAAAVHQQACFDKLAQGGTERSRGHVEPRSQKTRRKLAADRSADLGNFLYRCHTVEAGHKGVVQARRDR